MSRCRLFFFGCFRQEKQKKKKKKKTVCPTTHHLENRTCQKCQNTNKPSKYKGLMRVKKGDKILACIKEIEVLANLGTFFVLFAIKGNIKNI